MVAAGRDADRRRRGAFAAFFVLPEHTGPGIRSAIAAFFDALQDLITAIDARARGVVPDTPLAAASRKLDRCYDDLAVAVRPLGGPWTVVRRFGNVRERLLLLATCSYWAREVAHLSRSAIELDEVAQQRVSALTALILSRIQDLRSASPEWFEAGDRVGRALTPAPVSPVTTPTRHGAMIIALERLDELLQIASADAKDPKNTTASP